MLSIVIGVLAILALLFFFLTRNKTNNPQSQSKPAVVEVPKVKQDLGEIQIFFASQTGTAAKMAENFAQEITEHGFTGVVIDLKNITHGEFKENQISVFFMANTGEGEPPDNCVEFMDLLQGKIQLEGEKPHWKNMNFVVFGLGDTQYEHFNKIGIDTDRFLEKNGAKRLSQIGLGDNNSSIEDDYNDWKDPLWDVLIEFRRENPYFKQIKIDRKISSEQMISNKIQYLNQMKPVYANYKFVHVKKSILQEINEDELDFKTKAGLKGAESQINNIIEIRQDTKNGSTLQLEVALDKQPEYQTAGNIALWPKNDPTLIKEILEYFSLKPQNLIDIEIINESKKIKLNFVRPLTVRTLLEDYLDLQFRITKGLLKKLSKFQSDSPDYFLSNSSAKTTEQYRRLSEKQFCYLFKLIKNHKVNMSFEDFVELSDSVGPRLFTIASSWKVQKNVIIAASIVENGLISKHFLRNPTQMKAELRVSTFKDFEKWKKVIFVSAGTGFAPFRGFLQQKQLYMNASKEVPLLTLYFGCKYRDSDFIYRNEIEKWTQKGVINKLHLAFSREGQKKVYVQHLLSESKEELEQFIKDEECALYICGSVGMGGDVTKAVLNHIVESGKGNQEAKQILNAIQKEGRLIKQLW